MEHKLNMPTAGYHMLQILAAVDGEFNGTEDLVIRDFLIKSFPFHVNLDNEMDFLSKLKREDYEMHFQKAMDDFYMDSTEHERAKFIDFAVKLIKADKNISIEENEYLDMLFAAWEPDAV